MTRFRLDPELVEAAGLTRRQQEALEFYDGRNYGYRAVARELDIQFESARGLVRAGLAKIERATRPADERPQQRVPKAHKTHRQRVRAREKAPTSPAKPSKLTKADVFDSSVFFDFE
jgi:hypothetical protein